MRGRADAVGMRIMGAAWALAFLLALPAVGAEGVGDLRVSMQPTEISLAPGQVREVTVTLNGTMSCTTDEAPGHAWAWADHHAYMLDEAVVWSLSPSEFAGAPNLASAGGVPLVPSYEFEVAQEFSMHVESDVAMNRTVDSNVTFDGVIGGDQGCDIDGWEWRVIETDTLRIRVPGIQDAGAAGPSPGSGGQGAAGRLEGSSSDQAGLVLALTAAGILAMVGLVAWSRVRRR
jgi:hypothetical protein